MTPTSPHLSAEELDAVLDGTADTSLLRHAEDCAGCAKLLGQHRAVIQALDTLPRFAPSEDFADQVMFQVAVPDPFAMRSIATARRRVLSTARSRALAASVAVALVGTMAASIIWTALNRDVLASTGHWLGGEAMQWFWVALRGTFANVTEQPWFEAVRRLFGAPVRIALASALAMLLYGGGLYALRKLMTLPAEGAAHANA
jgi:hypothetical protein